MAEELDALVLGQDAELQGPLVPGRARGGGWPRRVAAAGLVLAALLAAALVCTTARRRGELRATTASVGDDALVEAFDQTTPVLTGAGNGAAAGAKASSSSNAGAGGVAEPKGPRRGGLLGKLFEHPEVRAARARYSPAAARAFAALAKLSYCGPLPGIYSAVAMSCSTLDLPGASSACEDSKFQVVPGLVRTVAHRDLKVEESLFGVVAKVQAMNESSPVRDGVLILFRGAVENLANSLREEDATMARGVAGCEACGVHEGYQQAAGKLAGEIARILAEFQCAEGCTVYVSGHGMGAALAALTAWDLSEKNHTIGTSYLFGMPRLGDAALGRRMNSRFGVRGAHGTLFSVTQGMDSVPRWPFGSAWASWGLEIHFKDLDAEAPVFCQSLAGDCGSKQYAMENLSAQENCRSALAPSNTFCDFENFGQQCYGGLGFQVVQHLAEHSPPPPRGVAPPTVGVEQPREAHAGSWHPSMGAGEQATQAAAAKDPKQWYSTDTLKAFAALTKITYCGVAPGVPNVVTSTCTGGRGVCQAAGFGVVPNSVVPVGVAQGGEADALFFYTALIRRINSTFAAPPYLMPSEACVLAIRGTANKPNMEMNTDYVQVPLNDTVCGPDCTVSRGYDEAWRTLLEPAVVKALGASGCQPGDGPSTGRVFVTGHSMGGAMATLAVYHLTRLGFDVQLSWSLEGVRPGNAAFMDFVLGRLLAGRRPVALWQVMHDNDGIPRFPRSTLGAQPGPAGRYWQHVYFNSSSGDASTPTVCASPQDWAGNATCGEYALRYGNLSWELPGAAHCSLPFAPRGQICMVPQMPFFMPYAMASQCSSGGALPQ